MSVVADMALIRAKFQADFDTTGIQTVYDNAVPVGLDGTQTWVRFGINPNDTERSSLGPDGFNTYRGLIWLQIYVPKGKGAKAAYEIGDTFAAIFRNWRAATDDLFTNPERMTPEPPDPDYYAIRVVIPYQSNR